MNKALFLAGLFVILIPHVEAMAASPANAQKKIKVTSYMTGGDLLNKGEGRLHYIAGILDGMALSPLFEHTKKGQSALSRLQTCIGKMEVQQLEARVIKYLGDNPSKWDLPANLVVLEFLTSSCQ